METKSRQKTENWMQLTFEARSENESLARLAVASFITPLNPTLEEMADVKTAASEAVTNAIIHGYEEEGGSCSSFSCTFSKGINSSLNTPPVPFLAP